MFRYNTPHIFVMSRLEGARYDRAERRHHSRRGSLKLAGKLTRANLTDTDVETAFAVCSPIAKS